MPDATFSCTEGEYTVVGSKPMWMQHMDLVLVFLRGAQVHVKKQEPGMFGPMLNPKRLELIRDYEYHISWPEKPREKVMPPYTEVDTQCKRLSNLPAGSIAAPGALVSYFEQPAISTKAKVVLRIPVEAMVFIDKGIQVDEMYDLIFVPHKSPLQHAIGDEGRVMAIRELLTEEHLGKLQAEETAPEDWMCKLLDKIADIVK